MIIFQLPATPVVQTIDYAKSGTTNNYPKGPGNKLNKSPFIHDSNDIKKFPKKFLSVEKSLFDFADLIPTERNFLKLRLLSSIRKALCKVFNGAGNFVPDIFGFFHFVF